MTPLISKIIGKYLSWVSYLKYLKGWGITGFQILLKKNHILTLSQHGFRSGKSVETASCHLLEHVYQCLDEGKYVVSLMFDLSKAFDTVNKEIRSLKLHSIGIRGNNLFWLMSYMESRSLVVHFNGEKSDVHDV